MIALDGHGLTLAQLRSIASERAPCALSETATLRMRESSVFTQRVARESRAVYGINTGFGPLSASRIEEHDLALHQINLLYHLTVGQGTLFAAHEVRAMMAARANALARGYSGIRPEVVGLLIEALNHDILPEIPSEGSVGASGDLVPLAHMAGMLLGNGYVHHGGVRMSAVDALESKSLAIVTLQAKEGLALVNGTSVMTGLACLSVIEAGQLLRWMEWHAACLFQILHASPEVLCGQLHKARGFRGQYEVAMRIADHLRSNPSYHDEIENHQWGTDAKPQTAGVEIQDPYSVRCVPQILGAIQETLWHIEEVTQRELNAATDNPLIFPETGCVIHGGNFYGQQISMTQDYLRMGLAKMALLADRQIERLVNWRYSQGLPPLLTGAAPGLNTGMGGCQLLATSLAAECRMLSSPASVQTIPTNANNQDIVSMGCTSAKLTRELLAKLWTVLAVEAMMLVQAADFREAGTMGEAFKPFRDAIRNVSPKLAGDRPLQHDIAEVRALLQGQELQKNIFGAN